MFFSKINGVLPEIFSKSYVVVSMICIFLTTIKSFPINILITGFSFIFIALLSCFNCMLCVFPPALAHFFYKILGSGFFGELFGLVVYWGLIVLIILIKALIYFSTSGFWNFIYNNKSKDYTMEALFIIDVIWFLIGVFCVK